MELRRGQAHTLGDQVVFLPEERILFTGDLVEERCFAIFPYFPPDDTDVDGDKWIAVLDLLRRSRRRSSCPATGSVGGASVIREARDYLTAFREKCAS